MAYWDRERRSPRLTPGPIDLKNRDHCSSGRSSQMKIGLFLSLLLVSSPSLAREEAAWAGVGTTSCANFASQFRKDPQLAEVIFMTWAQGFMSGLNTQYLPPHASTDLLSTDYPSDRQAVFIRSYCDNHPLKDFVQAVMELWTVMRHSQGR